MLEPSSDIALRPYQRDIFSLFSHGLDLKDLDGKCILVLGATGLIGSCIVDTLMFEAPTNFIGPCICAIIVVAVRIANKRVKILFIKRVVISFDF